MGMRWMIGVLALLSVLDAGAALAQAAPPIVIPPPVSVPTLPAGSEVRPFAFTHLVAKLTAGQEWSSPHGGWFCVAYPKVTWKGGQQEIRSADYLEAFRSEMKSAGFKVDGDSDNIFEKTTTTSDMEVGGIINEINLSYCLPGIGAGNSNTVHGEVVMGLQWQIYSSIQKTVLAKIDTRGGFQISGSGSGGWEALMIGAFKENVRGLIAAEAFRKTFLGAPIQAGEMARPTKQTPIPLPGAMAAGPRPISDAVGSVVIIFAGESQGSGFLVSSDGLLLTDRHVVEDAKFVKVRWPDGIEGLGEVVRSDKARDVALVKTDPRGRKPLRLRRDPAQPGDAVFAIGAPLGEKFQSTVTRGIVSANRVFEGLSFIQSDVSVNPGSSGGPLLDDKGVVVGMTEAGYRVGGAPADINLFTPVGDALDFLSAEPK
jgi:S1-C subfamily serine protease